jgi:CheY-like chemotaxis protein
VDDDRDTCELLLSILKYAGATAKATISCVKALELLSSFKPDILVADIALPGSDGYALIRQVRALPQEYRGQIPAIALTGLAYPADRARALSEGYQEHVPKPVDPDALVAIIARLLKRVK